MRTALAALLIVCGAALALAQSAPVASWEALLKPADRERIANLDASRQKGLKDAAGGKAADLRVATALLEAPALPLEPAKLAGNWRCRAIHVGGISNLTVNPYYACRILRARDGLYLEKITGGTRRKGRLVPIDEKRMLLYGSSRAAGDPALPYGTDDYRDEAGVFERIGPNRLRVEYPQPRYYNTAAHEVVELVRGR